MKKLFICALAVGMFTACSQEETLSTQAPMQISFDGAFVENATRAAEDPSITTGSIENFSVWAYVENANGTGQVFNDVTVTKTGDVWTYSPLQYWVPNNNYYFFAFATNKTTDYKGEVADATLKTEGIGEISFTNEDGTEDLLYATQTAKTGASITTAPDPVKFKFDHLLSKVKFTFKNGFATGYSTIKITDIMMTAPYQGTIALNTQGTYEWKNLTQGDNQLNFEDVEKGVAIAESAKGESDFERLTIPAAATQEYIVTFNVELLQDGVTVLPPTEQTVTIKNVELKPGFAYNFIASLDASNIAGGLFPIEFEAEVTEWIEPNDVGFIGVGGEIANDMILGTDVTATSKISLNNGVTFDGNGYTLSIVEADKSNLVSSTLRLIETTGAATIKNLTIDGNNVEYIDENGKSYGIRGIFMTGDGDVTIDNVTIKNVTYTLNTGNGTRSLTVKNSTLEGWTSYGTSTTASFENVKFECGAYANFKPYSSVTLTNCSFEEGFMIDFTSIGTGVVTLKNCTYNGTVLTAENFATVAKVDGTPNVAF